jgi:hypothetical protein
MVDERFGPLGEERIGKAGARLGARSSARTSIAGSFSISSLRHSGRNDGGAQDSLRKQELLEEISSKAAKMS